MKRLLIMLAVFAFLGISGRSGAESVSSLVDKAKEQYDKGYYDQAMESAGKALERDPKNLQALNIRGFCWFLKNKNDSALQDFNRAIELSPKYGYSYYNRGQVYVAQGKYALASSLAYD